MAALNLREDQTTGNLILEPRLLPGLISILGNLVWLIVIGLFFVVPTFFGGRFDPQFLIIFLILVLFSVVPSLGAIFSTAVTVEPTNRSLSRTTRLLLFPIRSTALSFSDLANIEVQFYRQSSGRSAHDAYRVSAMDKAGNRIALNWDGKRDETFTLAQKISAMTGAPLLEQSNQPPPQLVRMIELARRLGVPPQDLQTTKETASALEPLPPPDEDTAETILAQVTQPDAPAPEPSAPTETLVADSTTARDLSGMSAGELEKIVASDATDSDARYTLARQYHARGDLDRAIGMYQETLKVDTSNAEAQNDLGVALQQRGKRADAQAAYHRAIALDPFSFNAHLNLALLLRAMNRAAEASQEFFQARQNAQSAEEKQMAEAASGGAKVEPQMSNSL